MITSLREGQAFLQQGDPLLGIPLLVGGLVLMLFGWRLWRVCAGVSFGLVGYVIGLALAEGPDQQVVFALAGAVLLSLISFGPIDKTIALLGGIVGSLVAWQLLSTLRLPDVALWISAGVALAGCTALSAVYRRYVVILLTSVEGGALLLLGLVLLSRLMPGVYSELRGMAASSAIVVPFIVLVPVAISFFYQVSEVHRAGAEA